MVFHHAAAIFPLFSGVEALVNVYMLHAVCVMIYSPSLLPLQFVTHYFYQYANFSNCIKQEHGNMLIDFSRSIALIFYQ